MTPLEASGNTTEKGQHRPMFKHQRPTDYLIYLSFAVAAVVLAVTVREPIVAVYGPGSYTTTVVASAVAAFVAGLAVHRWRAAHLTLVCWTVVAVCIVEIAMLIVTNNRIALVLSGAVTGSMIVHLWLERLEKASWLERLEKAGGEDKPSDPGGPLVRRNELTILNPPPARTDLDTVKGEAEDLRRGNRIHFADWA